MLWWLECLCLQAAERPLGRSTSYLLIKEGLADVETEVRHENGTSAKRRVSGIEGSQSIGRTLLDEARGACSTEGPRLLTPPNKELLRGKITTRTTRTTGEREHHLILSCQLGCPEDNLSSAQERLLQAAQGPAPEAKVPTCG